MKIAAQLLLVLVLVITAYVINENGTIALSSVFNTTQVAVPPPTTVSTPVPTGSAQQTEPASPEKKNIVCQLGVTNEATLRQKPYLVLQMVVAVGKDVSGVSCAVTSPESVSISTGKTCKPYPGPSGRGVTVACPTAVISADSSGKSAPITTCWNESSNPCGSSPSTEGDGNTTDEGKTPEEIAQELQDDPELANNSGNQLEVPGDVFDEQYDYVVVDDNNQLSACNIDGCTKLSLWQNGANACTSTGQCVSLTDIEGTALAQGISQADLESKGLIFEEGSGSEPIPGALDSFSGYPNASDYGTGTPGSGGSSGGSTGSGGSGGSAPPIGGSNPVGSGGAGSGVPTYGSGGVGSGGPTTGIGGSSPYQSLQTPQSLQNPQSFIQRFVGNNPLTALSDFVTGQAAFRNSPQGQQGGQPQVIYVTPDFGTSTAQYRSIQTIASDIAAQTKTGSLARVDHFAQTLESVGGPNAINTENKSFGRIQDLIVEDEAIRALRVAEEEGKRAKNSVFCRANETAESCKIRREARAQEVERKVFVEELRDRVLPESAIEHFLAVYDGWIRPSPAPATRATSTLAVLNSTAPDGLSAYEITTTGTDFIFWVIDSVADATANAVSVLVNLITGGSSNHGVESIE